MSVRVLLEEDVGAFPRAVVGLVFLGRDDPIPAELDEVHRQRVAAAPSLRGRLVAVEPDGPLSSMLPPVRSNDFQKRDLFSKRTSLLSFILLLERIKAVVSSRPRS